MHRSIFAWLCAPLLLAVGGCFVVDDAHLESLRNGGGTDAGPPDGIDAGGGGDEDAGMENILNPRCGEPEQNYFVLRDTVEDLIIDTRGMGNSVRSRCGVANTGPNGFLAVEARAGQAWHFHITPLAGDLDPIIYLLDDACDARDCAFNANYCPDGPGEEHFAWIAPADGIYYLAVDDGTNQQGGQYDLDSYLLNCGDGNDGHGEACDGSGNCNSSCQAEVGDATVNAEIEVNDSQVEANHIVLPPSNRFRFSGTLIADGCVYPDVYSFDVPAGGAMAEVVPYDSSGVRCNASSLTDDLILSIRNSQNEVVVPPMTEAGTGCAVIEPRMLPEGTYFLWVDYVAPLTDRPVGYNLELSLTR